MDVFNGYALFAPEHILRIARDESIPTHVSESTTKLRSIAVGGDGGGNLFLLALPDSTIWKWLHETGTAVFVAPTFTAFLNRIAIDWSHFINHDNDWDFLSG